MSSCTCTYNIYMLMRVQKEEASKVNKAKQHSTPNVPVQVVKHWLRIYPVQGSSSIPKHCLLYFAQLSTFMYDYTWLRYMYVCAAWSAGVDVHVFNER